VPNEGAPIVEVVRTYLELRDRDQFRAGAALPANARVVQRASCPPAEYRRLYASVGGPWHWRDRLAWDDATLAAHLRSPDIALFELLVEGESAGYFELRRSGTDEVEIAYFGLVPSYIGRGLGGALLTEAVREAWRFGGGHVWLHTCTLDSPHALPNYKARGFTPYRVERYEAEVDPSGPGRSARDADRLHS
jgi:GNAT superfamily N-acetyltransferase